MSAINWKNIFNTEHHIYGDLVTAWEAAKKAEYPYILWSGRIYHTEEFIDTGYIYEDGKLFEEEKDDSNHLFV